MSEIGMKLKSKRAKLRPSKYIFTDSGIKGSIKNKIIMIWSKWRIRNSLVNELPWTTEPRVETEIATYEAVWALKRAISTSSSNSFDLIPILL